MTDYAREKLFQALDILVQDGSVQSRLAYAAELLIRLGNEDFSSDQQEVYASIMVALTCREAEREGEGTIAASTRALSNDDGSKIARQILSLFVDTYGGLAP